jgi:hypothetical protein
MTRARRSSLLLCLSILLGLAACEGKTGLVPDGGVQPQPGECSAENRICTGDPIDGHQVCRCVGEFECPKPEKCIGPRPVPPGDTDWQCTWGEFLYTCKGNPPTPPDGRGGWSCAQDAQGWTCTSTPVVPPGEVRWLCRVEGMDLICEQQPPDGKINWSCTGQSPSQVCKTADCLPPSGSGWTCTAGGAGEPAWTCVGVAASSPEGGGWQCAPFKPELSQWKCISSEACLPPGGGKLSCAMGSEFGGTTCWEVPPVITGQECVVGQKRWCDEPIYCQWGQVDCDPATGKWRRRADGKEDCNEVAVRPSTLCACYHTFFAEKCCERADCVVPPGTNGQVCAPSAGGLCDYCNGANPECKSPTGLCVWLGNETFCSQPCAGNAVCPTGYKCVGYKLNGVQSFVCQPVTASCGF